MFGQSKNKDKGKEKASKGKKKEVDRKSLLKRLEKSVEGDSRISIFSDFCQTEKLSEHWSALHQKLKSCHMEEVLDFFDSYLKFIQSDKQSKEKWASLYGRWVNEEDKPQYKQYKSQPKVNITAVTRLSLSELDDLIASIKGDEFELDSIHVGKDKPSARERLDKAVDESLRLIIHNPELNNFVKDLLNTSASDLKPSKTSTFKFGSQ